MTRRSRQISDVFDVPIAARIGIRKMFVARRDHLDISNLVETEAVDEPLHPQLDPRFFANVERTTGTE